MWQINFVIGFTLFALSQIVSGGLVKVRRKDCFRQVQNVSEGEGGTKNKKMLILQNLRV